MTPPVFSQKTIAILILSGYNSRVEQTEQLLVFEGDHCVESGPRPGVLTALKARFDSGAAGTLLVFDGSSGKQVDFDLRGSLADVLARNGPPAPRSGPGRPRLGVVGREISLLPRHWEWLEGQPNGASAAIRRLIDEGRRHDPAPGQARQAREATGRLMTALAGNLPGYEEALRALYAGDRAAFEGRVREWPVDVKEQALRLSGPL